VGGRFKDETSPPKFSASGCGRCRAARRVAHRERTNLSNAVRIVVGFPPGGGTDITARLIGQWLSERLGEPFIIENRGGPQAVFRLWSSPALPDRRFPAPGHFKIGPVATILLPN
jgi:hypothetical protein